MRVGVNGTAVGVDSVTVDFVRERQESSPTTDGLLAMDYGLPGSRSGGLALRCVASSHKMEYAKDEYEIPSTSSSE